jgi:hypothetical protein
MSNTEFRLIKFLNGHIAVRAVMFNVEGKISGLYLNPPRLVGKNLEELQAFQAQLAEAYNREVIELDLPLAAWMKENIVRRLYRREATSQLDAPTRENESAVFSYLIDNIQTEHEKFSRFLNNLEQGTQPINKNEIRKRRKPLEEAVLALLYTMKTVIAGGAQLRIYGQRPEGGDMSYNVAEITGFQNHIWATFTQSPDGYDRRHCDLTQVERVEVLPVAERSVAV